MKFLRNVRIQVHVVSDKYSRQSYVKVKVVKYVCYKSLEIIQISIWLKIKIEVKRKKRKERRARKRV